ncbi:SWIM zinc finger family protein [Antrihabitans sp. YC2-6]|uniref:SWIM zinc finger family protein n=1 Tax=Antrihabitans sp. YC2-6 TaxID=2799498 RepID=UPI001F28DA9A|nr:SWIM zinc finger family protein [Antrihabitans sp. YC2-6]
MIGRSAGDIAALAPDAASLATARRLGPQFSATGHHGSTLWGLCAGSAAKPYEVVADLGGPAFTCSCPSRRNPCKHALGLLIAWSEDAVPAQDAVAPFAVAWLESRTGQPSTQGSPKPRSSNPATVQQRADRVSAGLEDLETWLVDQIRTGLAQADRSFRTFESIAARMTDAQAPGVASTLRRIPYTVATREDWPARLLADYAQLHLLVAAHRRIEELPEPLAASVRSHIGYPIKAEAVLERPADSDHWMILGSRVTEENQLFARKLWLRGRDSRKWAVLLDFSFGSPNFPSEVPGPGFVIDLDIHFYPGAAPLRGKVGKRHSRPEPFTTLAGSTIDDSLADYAHALGADPWLRSWPMLLSDVVPTATSGQWRVVGADGAALPLTHPFDEPPPWKLLGISGGHPITVIGEWTGTGLQPVSVFTAGQVVQL